MRAPDGGQWPPRRRIDRNLAIHVHAGLGTVVGDAAHAKPSEVRGVGKHVAVTLRHLAAEPPAQQAASPRTNQNDLSTKHTEPS